MVRDYEALMLESTASGWGEGGLADFLFYCHRVQPSGGTSFERHLPKEHKYHFCPSPEAPGVCTQAKCKEILGTLQCSLPAESRYTFITNVLFCM